MGTGDRCDYSAATSVGVGAADDADAEDSGGDDALVCYTCGPILIVLIAAGITVSKWFWTVPKHYRENYDQLKDYAKLVNKKRK